MGYPRQQEWSNERLNKQNKTKTKEMREEYTYLLRPCLCTEHYTLFTYKMVIRSSKINHHLS
jgi:hypothetical protein